MAKELNLDPYQQKVCFYSGLLHDIGKIGIHDSILKKDSSLDEKEYEEMKSHPVISESMLQGIVANKDIILGVKHHHEKYDGSGYPSELSAGEIPLSARLIAVADTFDALISHRPYRKGVSPDTALGIMSKLSGSQLDPRVLKALESLILKSNMVKKTKKVA
jgi:HD-GYP domain-containing protein (c-di-GMP phosphodiesterase class II)